MQPWMWVLIGIVGVLLLIVLFRSAMGGARRPVAGRPVARRPAWGWRRPARRRAYWR
jgi:hypothetical protein